MLPFIFASVRNTIPLPGFYLLTAKEMFWFVVFAVIQTEVRATTVHANKKIVLWLTIS